MIKTAFYLGKQAEEIYYILKKDLTNDTFAPGAQLPTEKELCKRFQCSNLTLRKALRKLEEENHIESRRGAGRFVVNKRYPEKQNLNTNNTIAIMYLGDLETLTELNDLALSGGFNLIVYSQNREHWSPQKERMFFKNLLKQKPRVLLAFCSPLQPYNDDILYELENNGAKVIHIGYYKEDIPDASFILPDYYQTGYNAAVTFMLKNCKTAVYAGMPDDGPFAHLMSKGFFQALSDHKGYKNLPMNVDVYGEKGNFIIMPRIPHGKPKEIKRFKRVLLDKLVKPAGVFCATPDRVKTLKNVCAEIGVNIPEDISLITCTELNFTQKIAIDCDYFTFNRINTIKQFIRNIITTDNIKINKLLRPVLVRYTGH